MATLLCGASAESLGQPAPPVDYAERGVTQLKDGQYNAAISMFLTGYSRTKSPRFWLLLGQAYERAGRREQAVSMYQRFLNEDPRSAQRPEAEAGLLRLGASVPALPAPVASPPAAAEPPAPAAPQPAASPPQTEPVRESRPALQPVPAALPPLSPASAAQPSAIRLPPAQPPAPRPAEPAQPSSRPTPHTGAGTEPAAAPQAITAAPTLPQNGAPLKRPLWRIAAGTGGIELGLLLGGIGIWALSVHGQLIDPGGQNPLRTYDTAGVGTGLTVPGLLFAAAGSLCIAWPERRGPER